MNTITTTTTNLLDEDQERILPLLRLAQWASNASPAIAQICHLRDQVPSFRANFDALTPGLIFPEVRNAGPLVADVLALAIELLEQRQDSGKGGAA